jgi:hypothetical protein
MEEFDKKLKTIKSFNTREEEVDYSDFSDVDNDEKTLHKSDILSSNQQTVKRINNSLNINSTSDVNSVRNNKEVQKLQHRHSDNNSSNESDDEDEHQLDENRGDEDNDCKYHQSDIHSSNDSDINFDRNEFNNSFSFVNNLDKNLKNKNLFTNKINSSTEVDNIINQENVNFAKNYSFSMGKKVRFITPKKDFFPFRAYLLSIPIIDKEILLSLIDLKIQKQLERIH